METAKIYRLTNTINGKSYIGFTKRKLDERLKEHWEGNSKCKHLSRAIKLYGKESFSVEVLFESEWINFTYRCMEPFYIDLFQTRDSQNGYNICPGGMGLLGFWKGKSSPFKGRKHTDEARRKQSEAAKRRSKIFGRTHSTETKKKLSETLREGYRNGRTNYFKGKKRPSQTCDKMSAARKGKVYFAKTYEVTFPDGHVEIVTNMAEFCRNAGLSKGNMSSVAKGRLPHHKGFTCRYAWQ